MHPKMALQRQSGRKIARAARAARRNTPQHSTEIRPWGCSRGARGYAKARGDFCVLFREHSGRGGSLKRGRFTFGGNAPKTAVAWPKLGFGWQWPLPPPRLAWGAPGAYFDGKMHQKNLLNVPWEAAMVLDGFRSRRGVVLCAPCAPLRPQKKQISLA
jgi:hypothetical protein